MKALLYETFGGDVRVADVPDPAIPADGAVIRVAASGMCRSDWHAWAGHDDTVHLPHVPGHEFSGEIVAVGGEVRGWRVGERVTTPFVNGCGRCTWCLSGQAQVCPDQTQPGFTHPGSHAEFVAVRAADLNLVAVPDAISDDAAASLGCRFATAYRAVTARAGIRPGEWLAVFGAGGVGLSAVQIAAGLGARVIAVDPSPDARALAASLGAELVLDSASDVPAAIAEATGGGAHATLDAVGSAQIASTAILSLRRRGRHVQVGLLADPATAIPLGRVLAWELDVLGSHGMPAADYPRLLELVSTGVVDPARLLSRTVDLAEAAVLLPASGMPTAGITVLHPGG
jgi:alcohol dehydrogenase